MFVELMPLLAGRTVMITGAREDEKSDRVCIIPKKTKEDEIPALTTPLTYAGTPDELDVRALLDFLSGKLCNPQASTTWLRMSFQVF